ncbi:MAG: cell division protein FtsA [Paracoccaceae bacterium]
MNVHAFETWRAMRARLHAGLKRGRLGVIDVGSAKITCLVLAVDPSRLGLATRGPLDAGADRLASMLQGAVEVVGSASVQSHGIRRGEIVDMEEASRAMRLALITAEGRARPRVERGDQVVVGFSGGRPESFSTVGEVEIETGTVTDDDIARALAEAPDPPIGQGRAVLHAQPVELALDFRAGLTDPRGMTGRRLSVAIHVVAVDARPLADLIACLRRCDVEVAGVASASYAAGLAALVEDARRLGAVAIDLGAGSTGLSVFLRDHLVCVDGVRFGAERVTADIAAGLAVSETTAERLKCRHGGVIATGADDREAVDAPRLGEEEAPERRMISRGMLIGVIRPRVEETLRAVKARLEAHGVDRMPGCSLVLTGAGSSLTGMDELATRVFGRRPRMGRPPRIAGLDARLAGPESAAAVGLAAYALSPHDELWDFEAPRRVSAVGRATEIVRWIRTSW